MISTGSGNAPVLRITRRLIRSEGQITFLGREIHGLSQNQMRPLRGDMQIARVLGYLNVPDGVATRAPVFSPRGIVTNHVGTEVATLRVATV